MLLVLGLLGAGLAARAARAQEPEGAPDEPGLWAALDEDDAGPGMDHGSMGHGPGMGPGAMGHGRRMGRGGMGFEPGVMSQLDLTAEQREKMRAAHEREQRKAIQARADIQLAHLDLRKLMQAEKPDQRAIDAQIDRISTMRANLQKSHVATMLEFRASLTPEQQKKLRELHQQGPQRIRRVIRERTGGGGEL
jgi:Spy/CpxP family protein refolding chaperone